MPKITIHLSDELYNRLAEYARFVAGTLPERAARDLRRRIQMANHKGYYTQSRIGEYFYPDAWGTPVYAALRLNAEQIAEKYREEYPDAWIEVWETTLQCVSHCALEAQEDPVIVVDCYLKKVAEDTAPAYETADGDEVEDDEQYLGESTLKLRKP